MKNLLNLMFFLVLVISVFTRPALATPVFDDSANPSQLYGFTNILVNGANYSVEFVDGYNSIFDEDNLTFTSQDSANAAALALMAAYSTLSVEDYKVPDFTRGIEDWKDRQIMTPYLIVKSANGFQGVAYTYTYTYDHTTKYETTFSVCLWEMQDLTWYPKITWAVWTPSSSSPVPEPVTMALMGAGLISAAALVSRRKRIN